MFTSIAGFQPRSVICAALNFRATLATNAEVFTRDPHKEPPRAPVLYFKPPNTQIGPGDAIPCPPGVEALKMGGTLGVVIARRAYRVKPGEALGFIDGYCIANDVSVPHASYYRPAIKERCRDGFHPMGPAVTTTADPNQLAIRVFINGELRAENSTANLARPVEHLLADVTEFMTLEAGDVLCVGECDNAPLARIGDRVRIQITGLGSLENSLIGAPE